MIIQVVPKEVVLVFITRKSLCKLQYKTKKNMLLFYIDLLTKTLLNLIFLFGLKDLLSNIICTTLQLTNILSDLNARLARSYSKNIATSYGTQVDYLTNTHGFRKIISDPTDILHQTLSCIDYTFTDNLLL